MENHQMQIVDDFIIGEAPERLERVFKKLLGSAHPPKAIIAANDRVSTELLRFLKKEQQSIPHDVAVVCIDDIPYAEFFTPTLTTISQPTQEMAIKAASLLLQQISEEFNQVDAKQYRFKPMLHIRQSSQIDE